MAIPQHSSKSVEWYTPTIYVNAARNVMGGIDLDPASCKSANRRIKAETFYTKKDNGFIRPWFGRVWLNPPYGKEDGVSRQGLWTGKLRDQFKHGRVSQGLVLINAVPDRDWFKPLWDYPICFTDHRIKFIGAGNQPPHGNAFVYMGPLDRFGLFTAEFDIFGEVVITPRVMRVAKRRARQHSR